MVKLLLETVWQSLCKAEYALIPTISILGICPSEIKAHIHRRTCALKFAAALFCNRPNLYTDDVHTSLYVHYASIKN